jgi:predicted PolB exonuclease-like 3'-5' exonuclease
MQRVVAISCALRSNDGFRVWSLGSPADPEREIVQRFFDGIEKYTPQLVSWNGSGFDLPVLHYRAMIHGIAGCCYWDAGDNNKEFRFNNYLSRFHSRHTDLMDVLAGFQNRAWAPLDELGAPLRVPGEARHGRLPGMGGVDAGRDRGDSRLLRDRRRQHVSSSSSGSRCSAAC